MNSRPALSPLRRRPEGRRVGPGLGGTRRNDAPGHRRPVPWMKPVSLAASPYTPHDLDAPPLPIAATGRPLRARPVWPLAVRLRRIQDLRRGCARSSRRRSTEGGCGKLHHPSASRLGPSFGAPAARDALPLSRPPFRGRTTTATVRSDPLLLRPSPNAPTLAARAPDTIRTGPQSLVRRQGL